MLGDPVIVEKAKLLVVEEAVPEDEDDEDDEDDELVEPATMPPTPVLAPVLCTNVDPVMVAEPIVPVQDDPVGQQAICDTESSVHMLFDGQHTPELPTEEQLS